MALGLFFLKLKFLLLIHIQTRVVWEAQDVGNWKLFPYVTAILQSLQPATVQGRRNWRSVCLMWHHRSTCLFPLVSVSHMLHNLTINWPFIHYGQMFLSRTIHLKPKAMSSFWVHSVVDLVFTCDPLKTLTDLVHTAPFPMVYLQLSFYAHWTLLVGWLTAHVRKSNNP